MNGVTTGALSRQGTRRNFNLGEDAQYPQLDGKTPWSFTATWYWALAYRVQDRWEAENPARQGRGSRRWDTTLGVPRF